MIHQRLGEKLKKILKLDREPVAIKWSFKEPKKIPREDEKSRFCRKIEKSMRGEVFYSNLEDELCMGGARYSGLGDDRNYPTSLRSGNFLVAAGVYKNIPAVQRSWQNNLCIPKDIFQAVIFAPLGKSRVRTRRGFNSGKRPPEYGNFTRQRLRHGFSCDRC